MFDLFATEQSVDIAELTALKHQYVSKSESLFPTQHETTSIVKLREFMIKRTLISSASLAQNMKSFALMFVALATCFESVTALGIAVFLVSYLSVL